MTSSPPRREGRWEAPRLPLERGGVVEPLVLAYSTWGALNPARDNAVLVCTGASGLRGWAAPHVRTGGAFDPSRHFVVSVDPLGGGGSSKPSDELGRDFPPYEVADLVTALQRLVEDGLGLATLKAVVGPSMAGLVGLEWAVRSPGFVRSLALWVPGIRSDAHARAVADAIEAAVAAGPGLPDGGALRRAARLVAADLLGEDAPPEAVARIALAVGETWASTWDPDDLAWRYGAVGRCDLAQRHGGMAQLARRVRCPTLLIACTSDRIFGFEAAEAFAGLAPAAKLVAVASPMGHMAPAQPRGTAEFEIFDGATAAFLDCIA